MRPQTVGRGKVEPDRSAPWAGEHIAREAPGTIEADDVGGTMKREFDVLIERDSEGYYVATVPALRGCHTQARSLDDLMQRVREAVELCLEVQGDETGASLDFVGVQRIAVG
jgi:predicted RNase H-like HicB family nuclease